MRGTDVVAQVKFPFKHFLAQIALHMVILLVLRQSILTGTAHATQQTAKRSITTALSLPPARKQISCVNKH